MNIPKIIVILSIVLIFPSIAQQDIKGVEPLQIGSATFDISQLKKLGPKALPILDSLYFAEASKQSEVFAAVTAIVSQYPKESQKAVRILRHALQNEIPTVRADAAKSLGKIDLAAKETIQDLTKCLDDVDSGVKTAAVIALVNIAVSLQDNSASLTDEELRTAVIDLEKTVATAESKFTSESEIEFYVRPIHRSRRLLQLELKVRQDILHIFEQFLRERPFFIIIPLYLMTTIAFWTLLLFIKPSWIARIDVLFQKIPAEIAIPVWKEEKISLRKVIQICSLISFFRFQTRVLDACVIDYLPTVRKSFVKIMLERGQAFRIPLPVQIDGKLYESPSVELFQDIFRTNSIRLLIHGEGGVGKTNLACQLGRWALETDKERRLCLTHNMIPVLIDQEIDYNESANKTPLVDFVRGQLKMLFQAENPVDDELLRQLLIKRRILLIVDSFSEMSDKSRSLVKPNDPNFPANALIMTSRAEKTIFGEITNKIEPSRLNVHVLAAFVVKYIEESGKMAIFDDQNEILKYSYELGKIARGRDITVLLAKLYTEQIISLHYNKNDVVGLPQNVPELMLKYLNEINRIRQDGDPSDGDVYWATGYLAWECVKENYNPIAISRNQASDKLIQEFGQQKGRLLCDWLQTRLRLIIWDGDRRDHIRFAIDPLAEYLAAYILVSSPKITEEFINSLLEKADSLTAERGEEIVGFLTALDDNLEAWQQDKISRKTATYLKSILEKIKTR